MEQNNKMVCKHTKFTEVENQKIMEECELRNVRGLKNLIFSLLEENRELKAKLYEQQNTHLENDVRVIKQLLKSTYGKDKYNNAVKKVFGRDFD